MENSETKRSEEKKRLETWKPIHPKISTFQEDYLDEGLRKFLGSLSSSSSSNVDSFVKTETKDVYSFPVLNNTICKKLVEEIENFLDITKNSGIALRVSNLGLENMVKTMITDQIAPVIGLLFPQLKQMPYQIYPKLMTYDLGKNEDWPIHTDGDIATLNICLGKDFEGTDLRLYDKVDDNKYVDYKHQTGRMVIHLGDNRHAVTPLKSGQRYSLIVKLNKVGQNY